MFPVVSLPLYVLVAVAASSPAAQPPTTDVATYISAADVDATVAAAPAGEVSDQQLRHVDAGDGFLGVGVVQRPPKAAGTSLDGIQHHKQGEVYRVISGSGTLVTAKSLVDAKPLDPAGAIVLTLTGPSSIGVIAGGHSQTIGPGDVVIIPAGVVHGFSEITETLTYLVIRIDPEKLVRLK
jgi:mannose-6-phosphate isomerase-like protein (cupin superfamily)